MLFSKCWLMTCRRLAKASWSGVTKTQRTKTLTSHSNSQVSWVKNPYPPQVTWNFIPLKTWVLWHNGIYYSLYQNALNLTIIMYAGELLSSILASSMNSFWSASCICALWGSEFWGLSLFDTTKVSYLIAGK